MTSHEIPIARWADFLEEFSSEHRAWLAQVEHIPSGSQEARVVTRRFIDATADIEAHRASAIELHFHRLDEGYDTLRVSDPTTLSVEETADGSVQGLDIESRTGEHVRLHFRGTAPPETFLDGLAPGET
jgi:hypothetical protein